MKFTTEDQPDLTIPEDTILRARLEEISLDEFTWNDKGVEKKGQNLDWWWEVTVSPIGPQYLGRKVKGRCRPTITNREGNRFREWAEAILGREIPVGMTIDTDDLVGLEAQIVVGHQPDRKDPSKVWEFVSHVIPLDEQPGGSFEPPF